MGREEEGGGIYLVHFVNNPLDPRLRILYNADLNVQVIWFVRRGVIETGRRKYVVHNGEFRSLFWFSAPTGHNCIPNLVVQPLILTWVRWAGWPSTESNLLLHVNPIFVIVWQYTREDLMEISRSYQIVG
jgi:hypothetical protein